MTVCEINDLLKCPYAQKMLLIVSLITNLRINKNAYKYIFMVLFASDSDIQDLFCDR